MGSEIKKGGVSVHRAGCAKLNNRKSLKSPSRSPRVQDDKLLKTRTQNRDDSRRVVLESSKKTVSVKLSYIKPPCTARASPVAGARGLPRGVRQAAARAPLLAEKKQSSAPDKFRESSITELCSAIGVALGVDGFRILAPDGNTAGAADTHNENTMGKKIAGIIPKWGKGVHRVYEHVMFTREPVRLDTNSRNDRFLNVFQAEQGDCHAMWLALLNQEEGVAGILEIWRNSTDGRFKKQDEELVLYYLACGGVTRCPSRLLADLLRQRNLNDFLFTVVKSIFQDMVSMKVLMKKIINFAQRLVDADRASLFLVDHRAGELYATIFDSNVNDISEDAFPTDELGAQNIKDEIRFPLGTGIAGHVALTGEVLNIADAYNDSRFNKTVDQRTGYRTDTILCMPIRTRGATIGVVQMINKRVGSFTKEDEEAFSVFSVYCGLALHHAKLYERITRSEQKYKIALEVLSYHSGCSDEEVSAFAGGSPVSDSPRIDTYYFDSMHCDDYQKVNFTINMFMDMFGSHTFERESLLRFVLTVRKNYRNLPYHNWTHGFSVAHCMYSIIKSTETVFTQNESTALFISALCHDLDHRGKNNKFMMETESLLAAMYSTSTMEHHHFNQTVIIIQQLAQKGHNIFNRLTSSEYKEMLVFVKHCILATDLARFFPNKIMLEELVKNNTFSWDVRDHRMLLMAVTMTGCDLCASAKPWPVQMETVRVIFEEFYQQGDAERTAGRTPVPMMDRHQPGQQAACQVGFLTAICIPCYSLLSCVMSETHPLLDMCRSNLALWREIEARGGPPEAGAAAESGEERADTADEADRAAENFRVSDDEDTDVYLNDDLTDNLSLTLESDRLAPTFDEEDVPICKIDNLLGKTEH